jgi:hypothetical protein
MNVKRLLSGAAVPMVLSLVLFAACGGGATSQTSSATPVGGAVVNSDSVVTVKIQSLSAQSTGYPWKLDVLVQSTQDVDSLVNPVKDSVGKAVTVFTDQDMKAYTVNDVVAAKIKYTGDVNIPGGIRLYMYDVAAVSAQTTAATSIAPTTAVTTKPPANTSVPPTATVPGGNTGDGM